MDQRTVPHPLANPSPNCAPRGKSEACPPTPELATNFSQLGVRLPALVISPYAKPGYVSHEVHHSTSLTRFIEMLFDLWCNEMRKTRSVRGDDEYQDLRKAV